MGTPEFAVESLKILIENNQNVVAVITAGDKPSGRGQKLQISAVKAFALSHNIPVLQPLNLKSPDFLLELQSYKADLQIVVAFRMLPEVVWSMPPLGTFNLHGSLLPQYRGAAPINRAIMNGEKETGVTTFFIQHEIDTGSIIYQEHCPIGENDNAGVIHDKLMTIGANLVLKTVYDIQANRIQAISQNQLISNTDLLKHAPKIFKDDCKTNWFLSAAEVHNHIRGLSPYPTAFAELAAPSMENPITVKIFDSLIIETTDSNLKPGDILTDGKKYLHVATDKGLISILQIQLAGKKRMSIDEMLRGFVLNESMRFI